MRAILPRSAIPHIQNHRDTPVYHIHTLHSPLHVFRDGEHVLGIVQYADGTRLRDRIHGAFGQKGMCIERRKSVHTVRGLRHGGPTVLFDSVCDFPTGLHIFGE